METAALGIIGLITDLIKNANDASEERKAKVLELLNEQLTSLTTRINNLPAELAANDRAADELLDKKPE